MSKIEKPICPHEGNSHWFGDNAKVSKVNSFGKYMNCPFCKTSPDNLSDRSKEFIPFGDDWKLMMMRWTKKNLVNLLASKLTELLSERKKNGK